MKIVSLTQKRGEKHMVVCTKTLKTDSEFTLFTTKKNEHIYEYSQQ